jgi:hypothetical protein
MLMVFYSNELKKINAPEEESDRRMEIITMRGELLFLT